MIHYTMQQADVAIVGAGAAGLMAAIWAGRANLQGANARRIALIDSAKRLGAKILVSGGGRCNITHDRVEATAFAGSTPGAIRKVLSRFDEARTAEFFRNLGVEIKVEANGKIFPASDHASTVLEALLAEVKRVGVSIVHPFRVEQVRHEADGCFAVAGAGGCWTARRLILATGGRSLPRTGSDGHGYSLARGLGHSLTPRIFPALVPLTLPQGHFIRSLSGLTLPATLEVRSGTGRRLIAFTDSTLCTHFGLSGPSVLDISRYYLDACFEDPATTLVINWMPGETIESIDRMLQARDDRSVIGLLRGRLPERLARALCLEARVESSGPVSRLPREARRSLARTIGGMTLPIAGDRGFSAAEVTAGGVSLRELNLSTMESRRCPGLYLCGEICDVDGRIGGYNFQWAWSSGYVAGVSV